MEPTQTALIVAIPEAEEAVGRFRESLDPAASWGVPAHVTVLYPFLPPQQINDQSLTVLRKAIAGIPRFDVALTHIGWFGDTVVWLAPQPDRPFRNLTAAVWQRFPETTPYAGAHTEVVAHLTIGQDAPEPILSHAAETVSAQLPINATVAMVGLIAGTPGLSPWRTVCEFPLGADHADRLEDDPDQVADRPDRATGPAVADSVRTEGVGPDLDAVRPGRRQHG